MHIPENYLSPQTCAVMTAAVLPAWVTAIRNVKKNISRSKIPAIGIAAAFSFLGMMFNVPIPGGSTGHAVGGTLIAILLGPYAACLAVSVSLIIQAFIFGDGGILAIGANCFNMAFVLPFVGFAIYSFIKNHTKSRTGEMVGAAIGSYVGINAAALCAAIEFGIQPMLFKSASGNALYCPYDISVSIPAMMAGHLTVFGIVEVAFTVLVLTFVRQTEKDEEAFFSPRDNSVKTPLPVKILLGALIVLTPLGLLAEGTAWGEWGADEIAATGAGYVPEGMTNGFNFNALIPDYSVSGMPDALGYILSAVIGTALLVIIFKLVSLIGSGKKQGAVA
ncbi:MAG: cobalt transporter CbiM [Catonella sp.]|nr:cobalt transporter CbiM [Catonella sp.]MDY6355683.1 cobalt transporter CbiM [Catonella sp.]